MRKSSDLIPIMLGFIAVVIAGTGTAVAATGQLVNVVDPVTGTGAKVDAAGRLLTTTGTLTAVQPAPGPASKTVNGEYVLGSGEWVFLARTTAGQRLAVSALDLTTPSSADPGRTGMRFHTYQSREGEETTCPQSPETFGTNVVRVSYRRYAVGRPLETLHVAYPHPWVPAPPAPANRVNCYYAVAEYSTIYLGVTAQVL